MAETTLSIKNTKKPAPKWFRKTKTATGYLINGILS